MKSIFKKSLAVVMVVSMLLSMLAMPILAAADYVLGDKGDNDPCEHAGIEGAVEEKIVAPTCQKPGGTWNTCTVDGCGKVWVTDEKPIDTVNGHNMTETDQAPVEATCWRSGHTGGKVCTNEGCNYTTGEVIPQKEHKPVGNGNGCLLTTDVSAGCLTTGKVEYYCPFADMEAPEGETGCEGYNGEYDVVKDATGHTHSLVATNYQAPTCVKEGYVTLDCSVCAAGDFKVYIAAIGHDWKYVDGVTPDCDTEGNDAGYYCPNEWLEWTWDAEGTEHTAVKMSCTAYYNVSKNIGSRDNPAYATDADGKNLEVVPVEDDINEDVFDLPATEGHVWVDVTEETYKGEASYFAGECNANSDLVVKGWQWQECENCHKPNKVEFEPTHTFDPEDNREPVKGTCFATGYTLRYCTACKADIKINPTSKVHNWVVADDRTKVVVVFEKNGYLYTESGDQLLPEGNVTINYPPKMISYAVYEAGTDTKAVELTTTGGYTPIILTQDVAFSCGKDGEYGYRCKNSACGLSAFVTISIEHVWDYDWGTVEERKATCTDKGGYWGKCDRQDCGKMFPLSAVEVGDNDPDYAGPTDATGHKWLTGEGVPEKFTETRPYSQKTPTCTEYGWAKFEYCENEECSESLPKYADAYAAATKTKEEHKYFKDDYTGDPLDATLADLRIPEGKTWKDVVYDVKPSCTMMGFYVAKCENCNAPIYLDDEINPVVDQASGKRQYANTKFALAFEGGKDGKYYGDPTGQHNWITEGRKEDVPATCLTDGKYAKAKCGNQLHNGSACTAERDWCAEDVIPKLAVGQKPTLDQAREVESGKEFENTNWIVIKTDATCVNYAKIEIQCEYCYNLIQNGKTPVCDQKEVLWEGTTWGDHKIDSGDVEIYLTVEDAKQYGYKIDGDKYKADATNTYVMWRAPGTQDWYYVVANNVEDFCQNVDGEGYVAGNCITTNSEDFGLHIGSYECIYCKEAGLPAIKTFTVKKDHVRPTDTELENYDCEQEVFCKDADCGEKIADAAGHNYVVVTTQKLDDDGNPVVDKNGDPVMVPVRVNADNCMLISYNHIYCSKDTCDFDTRTMDPDDLQDEAFWTEAHKKAADYKEAAKAHTPATNMPYVMEDVLDPEGNPTFDENNQKIQVKKYIASCEKDLLCTECGTVLETAKGHDTQNPDGVFVPSTCVKKAEQVYTCARGKDCDKYDPKGETSTFDPETNVVTWKYIYTLEEHDYADHKYGMMIDTDGDKVKEFYAIPYLSQSVDCLNYAVKVWHCVNCDTSEKESGSYYADSFMDPTGHTLVDLGKAPHCTEYSWNYWACADCLPLDKACADPRHNTTTHCFNTDANHDCSKAADQVNCVKCCYAHTNCNGLTEDCVSCTDLLATQMYQTPDWKNELGLKGELEADNTAKEIAPTGHYYVEADLPEGLTINEGVVVAEDGKIYFDMTCVEAVKHGVKYTVEYTDENDLDENGDPKVKTEVKYWYPTCDGGCGKTVSPDDHVWDETNGGLTFERPATCTQNGLGWGNCTLCEAKDIKVVVPALGHNDLYWRLDPANTCCQAGKAVLACNTCKADVKVGDKLSDTIPALPVSLEETLTFTTPDKVDANVQLVIDLPKLECVFDVEDETTLAREEAATVHKAGVKYYHCINTFHDHECDELKPVETSKLAGVQFTGYVDNAVKPGNKIYVNGGKIAYTITIDAEAAFIFALELYVKFDATKLSFSAENYDFGENATNMFGDLKATNIGTKTIGADGYVSISGHVQPVSNEDGTNSTLTDYKVTKEETVVVLYFDILPGTLTDDVMASDYYTTAITICDVCDDADSSDDHTCQVCRYAPVVINSNEAADPSNPDDAFSNDEEIHITDAEEILVEKLGDVNVVKDAEGNTLFSDGYVNVMDVEAIVKLILSKNYDVRADINQDGFVDGDDLALVKEYIKFKKTYAQMVGVAVQ